MRKIKLRTETIIDIVNNIPKDKIQNAIDSISECVNQFLTVKIALDNAGGAVDSFIARWASIVPQTNRRR